MPIFNTNYYVSKLRKLDTKERKFLFNLARKEANTRIKEIKNKIGSFDE